jgi:hypothetical protein
VRPQNQRNTRAPNRGAKDDLCPNSVAHDGIEPTANEYLSQTAPRSPYRKRITDPHFAEVVEWDALADQLPFKSSIEAESELRRQVRAQVTIPRHREQKRLYAPVQIACTDMQDTHKITSA